MMNKSDQPLHNAPVYQPSKPAYQIFRQLSKQGHEVNASISNINQIFNQIEQEKAENQKSIFKFDRALDYKHYNLTDEEYKAMQAEKEAEQKRLEELKELKRLQALNPKQEIKIPKKKEYVSIYKFNVIKPANNNNNNSNRMSKSNQSSRPIHPLSSKNINPINLNNNNSNNQFQKTTNHQFLVSKSKKQPYSSKNNIEKPTISIQGPQEENKSSYDEDLDIKVQLETSIHLNDDQEELDEMQKEIQGEYLLTQGAYSVQNRSRKPSGSTNMSASGNSRGNKTLSQFPDYNKKNLHDVWYNECLNVQIEKMKKYIPSKNWRDPIMYQQEMNKKIQSQRRSMSQQRSRGNKSYNFLPKLA